MKEIKRLSQSVYSSLRSATFLSDLPRVVEELVYNSLDAGSSEVFVSVCIRECYVKVEDNGCGITRDGLVILGERYSTSKIQIVADVASTTETLGFRGEALASLSNISIVEIRSKARGKPNAYCKIIKCSKCLFFGIDEQREDVGTTVIVRDLFYNQPIRKNYMQSSIKKQLHSLKKCVFRIALVYPQVSFKLIDVESEDKLLCTFPSPSSLSLVTDGFGKEFSNSLREIVYSDHLFSLAGYISGPTDAFSTKAFQYLYINSRFICKCPIHSLINRLATASRSAMSRWMDNSNSRTKRQKTQGYPAYLLNLCCPMSVYDLSFEPSKTVVEFKDWSIILSFIEQAILPFWKQLASHLLHGISEEDMLNEGGVKAFELSTGEHGINLHENSLLGQFCHELDSHPHVTENYNNQTQSLEDQADICSLPKRHLSKVDDDEVANFLLQHDVNTLLDSSDLSCLRSSYLKRKRHNADDFTYSNLKDCFYSECISGKMPGEGNPTQEKMLKGEYGHILGDIEPCDIVDETIQFPLANHGLANKTCTSHFSLLENEEVSSICRSTSYGLGDDLDFWKKPFANKGYCTKTNWNNKTSNFSRDRTFKTHISNAQDQTSSFSPIVGAIRKCQTSSAQGSSLNCKISCCLEGPFLSGQNSPHHGRVANAVQVNSNLCSSLYFGYQDTFLSKASSKLHIIHDSILERDQSYNAGVGCGHYAIDEKNVESFNSYLNNSSEVQVDLNHADNCIPNQGICSIPIYSVHYDHSSVQLIPAKCASTCILDEKKDSKSFNSRHAEIFWNNLKIFRMKNYDDAVESASIDKEVKDFSYSNVHKLRLNRSQSAPPFVKCKKRFPVLKVLPIKAAAENSLVSSFHVPTGQLKRHNASESNIKPSGELLSPCSRAFNNEESNESSTIDLLNLEGFVEVVGCTLDVLDPASVSLSKWRQTSDTQLPLNHDHPQCSGDILDISSGLLHLAGSSLVPESISKECLDDAKVLPQLDRKYIPIVASGSLVIIDQHAADERIRLEGLRKKVLNGELSSITHLDKENEMVLPELGYQLLQKYVEQIKKWGWICNFENQCPESFSRNINTLRQQKCRAILVAVPHILGIDLTEKDLLEYIQQLAETDGSSIIPPSVVRILNYKACRGAIMFGDALLHSECSLVVEELKATSLCFQCAHGRPTSVPLVNLPSLHEQLSRLGTGMVGQQDEWHGLRRHTPSIDRSQQRLELSKSFLLA